MESKRFEIMAVNTEHVIEDGKSAIRIELQYGKAGQPTELVIAEMYSKDGKWAYGHGQVRVPCTADIATYVLKSTKAMYDSSLKVEKKVEAPKTLDISSLDLNSLTDEQRANLVAAILGSSKTEAKAPVKTAKATESTAELTLENIVNSISKRPISKKSK